MRTYQILVECISGADAVTIIRANSKRDAVRKFNTLVKSRKFTSKAHFFPPYEHKGVFKIRGQKPIMATLQIDDSDKSTVMDMPTKDIR